MDRRPEPELMDDQAEAQAYADADFRTVNDAFVGRLLELAGDVDEAAVADLGCGPCDITILVAKALPWWRITAVDGSAAMLDIARSKIAAAAITLHHGDVKASGLATAHFDIVFSNSLLHHIPDPDSLWREIRRIAKPQAIVFIRDLMRPETEDYAQNLVKLHAGEESALLQEEFVRSLRAAFTLDEVRAQLERAGLSNLTVARVSDRHLDVYGRLV